VISQAWRTLLWASLALFMALPRFVDRDRGIPQPPPNSWLSAANLSRILNAYAVVYAALLVPARAYRRRGGTTGPSLRCGWVDSRIARRCAHAPLLIGLGPNSSSG
jgi:hypothetical protein